MLTQPMIRRSLAFAVVLVVVARAHAGIIVTDPRFTPVRRGTFQGFPIQVDPSGDIYTVTSTSTSADLKRINSNDSVDTLNSHVGAVIGVLADLEFGFGGDLFANAQGRIRKFSRAGFGGSDFATGLLPPDAGLAFDSANQLLWVTGGSDLYAYNSSGILVDSIPGVTQGGPSGLAIDGGGQLVLITRGGGAFPPEIVRIDPTSKLSQQIVGLSSYGFLRGVAVSSADEVFFTSSNQTTGEGFVHRVSLNGTGLSLVATHTEIINGITTGPSGDGRGGESIYLAASNSREFFELRPEPVPEPSSLVRLGIGSIGLTFARVRQRRRDRTATFSSSAGR